MSKDPLSPFRKVNPIQCQQAWCCIGHLLTEKYKLVMVTSAAESCINRLGPSVFSSVAAHNWKDRERRCTVTTLTTIRTDFVLLLFHSLRERLLHSNSTWRINQTNSPAQNKEQTHLLAVLDSCLKIGERQQSMDIYTLGSNPKFSHSRDTLETF